MFDNENTLEKTWQAMKEMF